METLAPYPLNPFMQTADHHLHPPRSVSPHLAGGMLLLVMVFFCLLCTAPAYALGYGLPTSRLERCLAELGAEPEEEVLTDCLIRRAHLEKQIRPQCTHTVANRYPRIAARERVIQINRCMNASLKKSYTRMSQPSAPAIQRKAADNMVFDPEAGWRPRRRGEGRPNSFSDIPARPETEAEPETESQTADDLPASDG